MLQLSRFSEWWLLLWRSLGSKHTGSVVVAPGFSCSAACGIFPDQGSNPCPLHWQVDSYLLRQQGSPKLAVFLYIYIYIERERFMVASGLAVACGIFVAGHRLLSSCGVWVQYLQLSCLVAPRHVGSSFPDQASNPHLLHWKAHS